MLAKPLNFYLAAILAALGPGAAGAQDGASSERCRGLHRQILEAFSTGPSANLAVESGRLGAACAAWILSDLATVLSVTGRHLEAEDLAGRAVQVLDTIRPADDPSFLRPLEILCASRLQQGKLSMARQAFRSMQLVRTERPEDMALVHGIGAALLQMEHRPEAESEYLAGLSALERAGRGSSADSASMLNGLGALYISERRFEDAATVLDRAWTVFSTVPETVPLDLIKLLELRAGLHTRQGDWQRALEDLAWAVDLADRESNLDSTYRASLLGNYAALLRKTHQRRNARVVEKRASAFRAMQPGNALVDVTELQSQVKAGSH